jgi:hypothetical protein
MLRRLLLSAVLITALLLGAAPAALAANVRPGGGPAFGDHVSSMAPEHPIMNGRHFGECISGMARGECPHEHEP